MHGGEVKVECPHCRAENPETHKFCRECGAKLMRNCPRCATENLPTDKFCGECGYLLTHRKGKPVVDYSLPESFTPRFLADKIIASRPSIEGERKLVTVLFADVVSFTSISEKLDPEEIHHIMDGCFSVLMDEIHRYEGTIDKFTGDGVMALFGAPIAHEDHAQRACHAALSIQKAMIQYGSQIKKKSGVDFEMRVGINSGPVIVGSIGNDLRMEYTALGDTTNLAERMQTIAKPGSILVSIDTHRMVKDYFNLRSVGKVSAKGKQRELEAYELLQAKDVSSRFEASIAKGLTRFIGREKELPVLKQAFDRANSGFGQVVGIVGEAGVGKSRLLLEFKKDLPVLQHIYLEGHCLHYGSSMSYLPVLDVLRLYFDIREGEGNIAAKKKIYEKLSLLDLKLSTILPAMEDTLSLDVEDEQYMSLEPRQRRERIFEAIRDLLIRESQNRTIVVAVEDLHWIDRTSEEFLSYLIGWLANSRILLVLLYRPEYTHQWGSKSYYIQIGLDQLSSESSAELVQSILEGGEVIPEIQKLIVSRAGGNPLFVEEFTHTLLENGTIKKKDHRYILSRKESEIQVPDSIQGIISARIDRLEENLKKTMQVASVIGRDFAYRILLAITGMREELKPYLLELQGLEFIYEKKLFPELEYIFKHALTQEVAYNSLLATRRKKIHESIGQAIESLYADRLEEYYEVLAHHYRKSDDQGKAYQYLKLSGNKATGNYSNWEALRFYREAIEVLSKGPQTEENKRKDVEIRLMMDGPMAVLGYPGESLEILLEGERIARDLGDEKSTAILLGSIGLCHAFRGEPFQRMRYAEDCFKEAESIGDVELAAPAAFDLCSSYMIAGEHYKLMEVAQKALALIEHTGKEYECLRSPIEVNLYSALCAFCGYSMANLGDFGRGQAICDRSLLFALESKNVYSVGLAEIMYGSLFIVKGDGNNAIQHLRYAIKYGEEGQAIPLLGLSWMRLGQGHYFTGDLQNAINYIEKAIKIQNEAGLPMALSGHYYWLSMIHLDSGDLDKARVYAAEALERAQINNEKHLEGNSRILQGRILAKIEDSSIEQAENSMLQGLDILNELRLRPFSSQGHLYLGELYADTGRTEKARGYLQEAELSFQDMGMDYWVNRTQDVIKKL